MPWRTVWADRPHDPRLQILGLKKDHIDGPWRIIYNIQYVAFNMWCIVSATWYIIYRIWYINIRILQIMVSGIPLLRGLGARMSNPYVTFTWSAGPLDLSVGIVELRIHLLKRKQDLS